MRLNKFIARATGKSRREADDLIARGRIKIGEKVAKLGAQINEETDKIFLDNKELTFEKKRSLIILNKPTGYVSSRNAQSREARTLYELLPPEFRELKTVGRLDKDSSGLILLTNDGDFAFEMTHPKFVKTKIYLAQLDKPLAPLHQQMISDFGVNLPDGKSRLVLSGLSPDEISKNDARAIDFDLHKKDPRTFWRIAMSEGRNRQIRRTFMSLNYQVIKLHRTSFGDFHLADLKSGEWRKIE